MLLEDFQKGGRVFVGRTGFYEKSAPFGREAVLGLIDLKNHVLTIILSEFA